MREGQEETESEIKRFGEGFMCSRTLLVIYQNGDYATLDIYQGWIMEDTQRLYLTVTSKDREGEDGQRKNVSTW